MAECDQIGKGCPFYFWKNMRGFEALTPEYKQEVCHESSMECYLWDREDVNRELKPCQK